MRPSLLIANGIILAAALLWLLILAISVMQPYRAAPVVAAEARVDTPATTSELRRGWYGCVLRLDGSHEVSQFDQAIDEIAAMHANSVLLEVPLLQDNPESTELSLEGLECPLLTDLVSVIHHAQERGLGVVLVPTIVFHEVKASQSRSRFAPADWDRWWVSYESAILKLAELAQSSGVEVFAVGSELSESEIMTTQWMRLVSQVRSRFGGLVMYNAQWERATRVGFWEHVDIIGVSAWFPLIRGEDQSLESLEGIWKQALEEVDLLATRSDRPVLFTAVGYPSRAKGLAEPWDAGQPISETADERVQADALSAFLRRFEAVDPRYPRHAGFFVYRWGAGNDDSDPTSHIIEGKQAEAIVRDALGRLTQRK